MYHCHSEVECKINRMHTLPHQHFKRLVTRPRPLQKFFYKNVLHQMTTCANTPMVFANDTDMCRNHWQIAWWMTSKLLHTLSSLIIWEIVPVCKNWRNIYTVNIVCQCRLHTIPVILTDRSHFTNTNQDRLIWSRKCESTQSMANSLYKPLIRALWNWNYVKMESVPSSLMCVDT